LNLRLLWGRIALALLLLCAQQQAALHWLSHAVQATHGKTGAPPSDLHCDACLAFSGVGAAPTSAAPFIPASLARHVAVGCPPTVASPAALRLAFRSRAPPILS